MSKNVNSTVGYTLVVEDLSLINSISILNWFTMFKMNFDKIKTDVIFFVQNTDIAVSVEAFDVNTQKSLSGHFCRVTTDEFSKFFRSDPMRTFKFKVNKEKTESESEPTTNE